jgi:hypothetical protein
MIVDPLALAVRLFPYPNANPILQNNTQSAETVYRRIATRLVQNAQGSLR